MTEPKDIWPPSPSLSPPQDQARPKPRAGMLGGLALAAGVLSFLLFITMAVALSLPLAVVGFIVGLRVERQSLPGKIGMVVCALLVLVQAILLAFPRLQVS